MIECQTFNLTINYKKYQNISKIFYKLLKIFKIIIYIIKLSKCLTLNFI